MKFAVLIIACIAIVAVQTASVQNDLNLADESLVEKQRFALEILFHLDQELLMEEWIKCGSKLMTDESLYSQYDDYMKKFYNSWKLGGLLPRGEFYSSMQRIHVIQTMGLFKFFYYATSWDTLVKNVAWARINVNEGMFLHAFTMSAIHREDMKGIILPQIYEILPQMFFNSKYIMQAEKFDWDVWNRQIMLEKELKMIYEEDPANVAFDKRFYSRDWKIWQWWKLMGLDDGWHMEEKSMILKNSKLMRDDAMWSSIYSKMKMVWMPMDYTRDVEIMNADSKLSYFTEDVGWNSYWYYLNMDYSKLLLSEDFALDKDRRGEWWIFNLCQMLTRLYMERLSNGLGDIESFDLDGVVMAGYKPQMMALNGNVFNMRKNNWHIKSNQNNELSNKLKNVERRIMDIVNSGRFVMSNGTVVDLKQPNAMEIIANMLQGNVDVLDWYFFGHWWVLSSKHVSGEKYHAFKIAPNVMMNYETMLRDPMFYSMNKFCVTAFMQLKYQLEPYTKEDLLMPSVKIEEFEVSKLMTYFDISDIDLTTLLNDKMVWKDGKLVWEKVLLGRLARLNHEDFEMTFTLMSDIEQEVTLRIFMAPEFNEYGEKIALFRNTGNFIKLDKFKCTLNPGKNVIKRNSKDFPWTYTDSPTYSELYNYLMMSSDGKYKFQQNITHSHSLFPDRLILPRGWVGGMPMSIFVMASPYTADNEQYATYDPSWQSGIGSGVRHVDNMPFGYPLDRKIEDLNEFLVPNMLLKSVKIYHMDKLDQYYPMKYENYGSFDYNY